MQTDPEEPLRLIQRGLDRLGHSPGAIDGLWGLRTARAMKALLAANGRAASLARAGPLPWITEAKTALGRNEARDCSWLMDWLKRDGRSLGDRDGPPRAFDMAENMGSAGCPSPWRKALHGRPGTTHRGDPSPDVGG